jgi:hypothetical protein
MLFVLGRITMKIKVDTPNAKKIKMKHLHIGKFVNSLGSIGS